MSSTFVVIYIVAVTGVKFVLVEILAVAVTDTVRGLTDRYLYAGEMLAEAD